MIDRLEDAFKEESKELLTDLEQTLLDLEDDIENMELIGKTFRILHTLKGSSGMFGFDEVAVFIHDIETAFEHIRNGEMTFTKEIADLTFKACDQVNQMIFNPDGKGVDEKLTKEIIETFRNLIKEFDEDNKINMDLDSQVVAKPEIVKANSYLIKFAPEKDIMTFGNDPLSLIYELNELGDTIVVAYLHSIPPFDEINPEQIYFRWNILLTTSKSVDTIKDVFIFVDDLCELDILSCEEEFDLSDYELKNSVTAKLMADEEISVQMLKDSVKQFISPEESDDIFSGTKIGGDKKKAKEAVKSIRVSSDKLDELVNLVGELVTVQAGLTQLVAAMHDTKLLSVSEQIERLTWDLRDSTLNIRMLPIGSTFNKFKRLVRDLSKELGKQVELTTEGADTELDKNVLEKLNDPLIHIIRNCIDHGVETPEARIEKGKNRMGSVHLAAKQSGGNVVIEISDDGKGLNKEAILNKAVSQGIISADAELTSHEINNLICRPGFSTSQEITNVSGRGVGMDVVKQEIENLRGMVEINSEEHKGTKILLKLPLTLAIIDGLLVQVCESSYILPLAAVEECVELSQKEIDFSHGRHIINIRDEIVPYVVLREVFEIPGERPEIEQIVIVNIEGMRTGFVVDEVKGQHQTVLKSLGKVYKDVEGISGATVLGDGGIALILDVLKLAQLREQEEIENYS